MSLRFSAYAGLLGFVGVLVGACATGSPTETDDGGGGAGASGGAGDPECAGEPDGTPCGDASEGACDLADTCQAGVCSANVVPDGTACGETEGTECDPADVCDGGACRDVLAPSGTACGDPTDSICTAPDTCDGMGTCEAHHQPVGYGCGDTTSDECTGPDTCDGEGNCLENHEPDGTACGDGTDDQCTDPDTCDGLGTCQLHDEPSGTACGDQSNTACTAPDTCDGAGTCDANHALVGTSCGSVLDTDCNNPDSCNGNGLCLANFVLDGTVCNDCPQGTGLCDGCAMGTCLDVCIPPVDSLQTTLVQNNGLSGVMFDVEAKNDIVVTRLETILDDVTHDVYIWYVAGGKGGHEMTMGDWTFVDNATVVGAGFATSPAASVPTEIPIDIDLFIPAGQTYGFYIHSVPSGGGAPIKYRDGTAENTVYVQNVDLKIFQGRGVGSSFFNSFQPSPRVFAGIVNYELPCP